MRPIVLIVDDEPALLVAAKRVLMASFEVVSASSVTDALEKSKGKVLAAVLTDFSMPGGSGVTLLNELCKREGHKVPALLVTAYADDPDIDQAVASGMISRIIPKPWTPSVLLAEAQKVAGL